MSDESRVSQEFAVAFKAFLDSVTAQVPTKASVFRARLHEHFGVEPMGLPVVAGGFEVPDHPNVQRALDGFLSERDRSCEVLGVSMDPYGRCSLGTLLGPEDHVSQPGPVAYASVALADEVLPCLQNGLCLVSGSEERVAIFVRGPNDMGFRANVNVEVMARSRDEAERVLADLRRRIRETNVYRGRVLSLYTDEMRAVRVSFHRLGTVPRESIILPDGLLERVERQTMSVANHANRLRALGRHLKRGLLLYGPPGTGKTLLTRYVINAMPDRTVLLLTGRGMALLEQSCALARTLQPATVVIEDVDLVAEERTRPGQGCNNGLLFELLNEMDGLEDDADIVFVLTTNRPEILEPALASRPGRVDQAIEVPAPDSSCRRRLFELYGRGLDLPSDATEGYVRRTEGVSAAFIRELLRRSALYAADEGAGPVTERHVDQALHELVVQGGELTRSLLGAGGRPS